jgi:Tfp pilus assembly protein PilN
LGLLLIQLFILLTYSGWYAEREIASLQKQLASIQQQVHQVSELRSSTARLENQFSELMTRAKTRPYTLTVLKELNSLLPNDTWLTQLRLSSRQLQIEGYSGAATGLVKRLDDSALFESTRFSSPLAGSKTGQQAFKIMTVLSKND